MDHRQTGLKGSVEGIYGRTLGLGVAILNERFRILDVDVAEVGVPVLIGDGRCRGELAVGKGDVNFLGSNGKLVKDPLLGERFVASL